MPGKTQLSPPLCFSSSPSLFHELMEKRVTKLLLILCPYDAFLMEDGGSFTSRIVSEYRGLNLSHPPRIVRAANGKEALALLETQRFDLVITLPQLDDMDGYTLAAAIKKRDSQLPVILLARHPHEAYASSQGRTEQVFDRIFVWSANPNFLLALVKNIEDHLNADKDTQVAMVRIILLVEDSPSSLSFFLPLLYHEVVQQTQAVMDESLTPEQRLLKMRARPKILIAQTFEEALRIYEKYKSFIFSVFADTRFPKNQELDDLAGIKLLELIRADFGDKALLLMSSEEQNRYYAEKLHTTFLNKNSPTLQEELHNFFLNHLGFGDFIFRLPDQKEINRASTLADFEKKLATIPDESFLFHARNNHFSHWIMARSEVELAGLLHRNGLPEATTTADLRNQVIREVRVLRKKRQHGLVTQFSAKEYDADLCDFTKIGTGSMGGKALGLAFMASVLREHPELTSHFEGVTVSVPRTLVITTDGFESFISENKLQYLTGEESDQKIAAACLAADLPQWLQENLRAFLAQNTTPLSIRSSSMLEDLRFRPYAGLFETYMMPNSHRDIDVRLSQLMQGIKLVYASTFFAAPKAFSKAIGHPAGHDDSMAILIQHICGQKHGHYFYPDISGVALSQNFYLVENMRPDHGVASIALGFGKTVVEGEKSLLFCPKFPQKLPQFSTVEDILATCQQEFYALNLKHKCRENACHGDSNLEKRKIADAENERPVQTLSSTYIPEEHQIRDGQYRGPKIITFASILKHRLFPLPEILSDVLAYGKRGLGCQVEIEFAVSLNQSGKGGMFSFLQIRPMAGAGGQNALQITPEEKSRAVCFSTQSLGHGQFTDIADIIIVNPESFRVTETREIAREISRLNAALVKTGKPYLLIGPGRWGSQDPLLGIPVKWQDIGGVGAIIELRNEQLKAEPSQGTHFFQNITSLGIPYITVTEGAEQFLDWRWLNKQPLTSKTPHVLHRQAKKPFFIKVDGHHSTCVICPS